MVALFLPAGGYSLGPSTTSAMAGIHLQSISEFKQGFNTSLPSKTPCSQPLIPQDPPPALLNALPITWSHFESRKCALYLHTYVCRASWLLLHARFTSLSNVKIVRRSGILRRSAILPAKSRLRRWKHAKAEACATSALLASAERKATSMISRKAIRRCRELSALQQVTSALLANAQKKGVALADCKQRSRLTECVHLWQSLPCATKQTPKEVTKQTPKEVTKQTPKRKSPLKKRNTRPKKANRQQARIARSWLQISHRISSAAKIKQIKQIVAAAVRSVTQLKDCSDCSCRIEVRNLPLAITSLELQAVFEQIGPVTGAQVMCDTSGKKLGWGSVEFADPKDAVEAIDRFEGVNWMLRRMEVSAAIDGAVAAQALNAVLKAYPDTAGPIPIWLSDYLPPATKDCAGPPAAVLQRLQQWLLKNNQLRRATSYRSAIKVVSELCKGWNWPQRPRKQNNIH